MKDAAKILLDFGSLESYIKSFIEDSSLEYMSASLRDIHFEEIKEGLIDSGEDLSDYDPIYDDWDELITSEKENLIEEGAKLLKDYFQIHGDIITKYSDKIDNILYLEVEKYFQTVGVDIFYG